MRNAFNKNRRHGSATEMHALRRQDYSDDFHAGSAVLGAAGLDLFQQLLRLLLLLWISISDDLFEDTPGAVTVTELNIGLCKIELGGDFILLTLFRGIR